MGILWASDDIFEAVRAGDVAKVEELLEKNPELVNAKNYVDCTPLYIAAENGNREMIDLLISRGAEVNVQATDGYTTLHCAARYGQKELVEFFSM